MKTKILSLITVFALMTGLSACHDDGGIPEKPQVVEEGQVNLRSMGVEINNAEKVVPSSASTTKSRASLDLSDYIVELYNSRGERVESYNYGSMPEIMTLPTGSYKVRIHSHVVQKAEWERPYFHGETDFTVKSDTITNIGTVTCKLKNIKVSIRFSDLLKKYMGDDCTVTVVANDEGRLEFGRGETRSGYFQALEGSSTLVAVFNGTVGGHPETLTHTCSDVEAGHHRLITFKLKNVGPDEIDETGVIDINDGIALDAEVTSEDLNAKISYEEPTLDSKDRPGSDEAPDEGSGEDPNPPTPPTPTDNPITLEPVGASFDKENTPPSDGSEVSITISAPNGLAHIVVSINSTNPNFMGAVEELMPLKFDLAYPDTEELATQLSSIGFPVKDGVINQTEILFDITQFMGLLNGFEGKHDFQISVTDNKSQQEVRTLTFKVIKP